MTAELYILNGCPCVRRLASDCTEIRPVVQSAHRRLPTPLTGVSCSGFLGTTISDGGDPNPRRRNPGKPFVPRQRRCVRAQSLRTHPLETGRANLKLRLDHQVQFGEHHALIGSAEAMGSWQKKTVMNWTESGWVIDLVLNVGERIEFKYIIVLGNGEIIWEDGSNRVIEVPKGGSFDVVCRWNNTEGITRLDDKDDASGFVHMPEESTEIGDASQNGSATKSKEQSEVGTSFTQEWQGKDISFMRSNDHTRGGAGKWDTSGLEGPALLLVDGDKNANNWWRKLDLVQNLLIGDTGKTRRLDTLVNISIYLKWINTGQIRCHEDGGHHRPNRHAEIARLIFQELERVSSDKNLTAQELAVVRKIHPCLPSFKSEFTASVPLTRIRDIAHRNDIPHDLKQEIKHTIQNKLHRNAGPEDLVATELLLARVTKNPGEYNAAFVKELEIFFDELKDFFNAGSLVEQLESVRHALEDHDISILEDFLAQKKKLDETGEITSDAGRGAEDIITTMHALTSLRAVLIKGLRSGLRNDASDQAIAMRQKWRLCEIGLEDYAFVLLSRFINTLETMGVGETLVNEAQSTNVSMWNQPLGAVVLGIRQLGLSGWQQGECMAIENEIQAWQAAGLTEKEGREDGRRIWALRFKATLERARRLSEAYSEMLLHIFPKNVEKLGCALGIPENTVRCYTEAEIRASVVFQLSKLSSRLLKALRMVAGEEGWDPIVPGTAIGTLVEVDRIVPGSLPTSANGPIILLVKEADGDEEIKASGQDVAGVVLLQELPHLSHLGVRARQEKVVFVTCEDDDKIASIRSLLGRPVKLEASAEAVHMSEHEGRATDSFTRESKTLKASGKSKAVHSKLEASSGSKVAHQSKVVTSLAGTVLDLTSVDSQRAGAKAASCGQLAVLANQAKKVYNDQGVPAAFRVPVGRVIPFGAMEAALQGSGDDQKFNELLGKTETAQIEGGELDSICTELQNLVAAQRPPPSVIDKIIKSMPSNSRLIVRSSANVEDLEGMSGAGLYESIPNVRASEPDSFGRAVAQVWASLYTRRAILSRRFAGVPQKEAAMAVLVQELLSPHLSFVLHTVSPIDRCEEVVEAEIASGLGETLASGTRGTPWRIAGNKFDGSVRTLAFANFSEELVVPDGAADGNVKHQTVDYSTKPLSTDSKFREKIGQQLATIGFFLEQSFGLPQDVEGCTVGQEIYVVQARPQP